MWTNCCGCPTEPLESIRTWLSRRTPPSDAPSAANAKKNALSTCTSPKNLNICWIDLARIDSHHLQLQQRHLPVRSPRMGVSCRTDLFRAKPRDAESSPSVSHFLQGLDPLGGVRLVTFFAVFFFAVFFFATISLISFLYKGLCPIKYLPMFFLRTLAFIQTLLRSFYRPIDPLNTLTRYLLITS